MYLSRSSAKKSGSVLIMALWIITIMAIFGLGLSRVSYATYRFAKFRRDSLLSLHAMESVVALCKYDRIEDETPGYDGLSEMPQETEYIYGGIKAVYSVTDEERKINLNRMPSSVLKELPGMDMDMAVALVNSEFRPYEPKEELLLVDEIDREDYLAIKDSITIYGRGALNINTCSEETLKIAGLDSELADIIIEFREGEDGLLGTEDDITFETVSGIMDTLKEELYLSLHNEQALFTFISKGLLCVKSENYRIDAGFYAGDRLVNRYSVILGLDLIKGTYCVKKWARN